MSKATKAMSRTLDDGTQVTVSNIKRQNVIAGDVRVSARVSYVFDDGSTDTGNLWEIQGSVYGGPVVAFVGSGQVFVRDPERFGSFATDPREWMRRYVLNES